MAQYVIPNYKLPELEKKINRIRNKGANVIFNIVEPDITVPVPELGRDARILCSRVEVEGEYRLNGWCFVATIQHAQPENIIRVADTSFEGRIPERYWTAPRQCEHCRITRDRNDTYLVYNQEEDEWKQVGRTCLQGYTNGLNAETCAALASLVAEVDRLSNQVVNDEYDDEMYSLLRDSGSVVWDMDTIKKKAYKYVVDNGYESGETGRRFNNALVENPEMPEASDEEIQNVQNFLETTTRSDWSRNCLAAWTKPYYESRDAGLITSAVSVYLRNHERELARQARLNDENNTFAGQVGDKITFTIQEVRVAYWREGGNYYHSVSYPVYKILGTDGNTYLWGCSQDIELHPGDRLTGTIKRLTERPDGEKQTEVTRCKLV